MNGPDNLTPFRQRDERAEIARLKRLTGLAFESVPQSLLRAAPGPTRTPEAAGDAEYPHRLPRPSRA